ncbi:MAG: hypothetical protein LBI34_00570 [Puniceicoccales bacterium]|nr:hypothetical protein [Puniceicoccales bacterium]
MQTFSHVCGNYAHFSLAIQSFIYELSQNLAMQGLLGFAQQRYNFFTAGAGGGPRPLVLERAVEEVKELYMYAREAGGVTPYHFLAHIMPVAERHFHERKAFIFSAISALHDPRYMGVILLAFNAWR